MTSSPATHAYVPPAEPEIDPFSLPLLNSANVATFREHHGVRTHDDLHQVIATRDVLITAYNALLDPLFDQVGVQGAFDGLDYAIEVLDAVIDPTEESLCSFFVEDWMFEVVDGECRVRYEPLTEEDWRMMQEAAS